MGAVSSTLEAVTDVASGVGDIVSGAVDTVKNVGSKVDDFVNNEIPGGWATVAAVTAGAAGLPSPVATETTTSGLLSGAGEGAFPGATAGTVASDAGAQTLSSGLSATIPETPILNPTPASTTTGGLLTGQGEGAFPGLTEGTVASDSGLQAVSVPPTLSAPADAGLMTGQGEGAFPGATQGTVASDTGGVLTGETTQSGFGQNLLQRFLGNQIMADLFSPQTVGGLLSGAGGLVAGQQDVAARQQLADQLRAAGQQAAVQAQFRPIGITTRFGTSQFQVNPQTGQLEAAGYTTSPEFQALQNRLMGLAGTGLTQAEQAQAEFAPLTGAAQGLFGLGQQYLAQSPQEVAQKYMESQQALLQPERERQLATIRNRLQKTGRAGLSVAQGGELGAANPELQAYYNALAQQNAQLAANAQQAGQQQLAFGTGLFGQGAGLLGQTYAGQQAALAPFAQYLSGVSGLETQAQQPLGLSSNLGQLSSGAGYRSGYLGLQGNLGAAQAMYPATSYSALGNILGGLGSSPLASGLIGQGLGGLLSSGIGLLGSGAQSSLANTAIGGSGFGTGLAYGNQDIGLFI
jgi:hypothetical protein